MNPQLPTLDINLIIFVLLPSFIDSILCQLPSTCLRSQHMLKLSHGVLRKPPRNHIYHFFFIPDPPKCIATFSAKLHVLLINKAKEKVRLGVVDLVFSLIILHPFLLIKEFMSCILILIYLSHLNQQIRQHIHRFGNCFMHLWGI